MSYLKESDKVRRSIDRGDPQPTYMSQCQKDALQVLIDLTLKQQTLTPQKQEGSNVKLTGAEQASLAERPVERRVGGLDSCPRCLMEAHLSLLSCGDNDTRGCEIHGSMTQDEMAIYNADVMKDATALYFLSWNYQVQARRASRNGGKL